MRTGIKKKIVIMNIAVLIPVIILICVITIYNLHVKIINNSIEMLKKESNNSQVFVMNYLEDQDTAHVYKFLKDMSPFIATYLSNNCKTRVQLYDSYELIADSDDYFDVEKDKDIFQAVQGKKSYIIREFKNNSYILFSSPIYYKNTSIGCIRYIYDLNKENGIIINTILSMIFFGIMAILISIIMSNLFSKRIVKPIVVLKTAAEQVSCGDFSKNISIDSGDEVEELANSFNIMSNNINNMLLKLKEEKEKQKGFLDNVTHELKTPLTSIIGYADLVVRVKSKEDIEQCAHYIGKSGDRLLSLVEDLLKLSKLNKNELEIKKSSEDINLIIKECINLLRPRIHKFGINIETKLFEKFVYLSKERTEQVILNVLDNAIKYSECNKIYITMESDEDIFKIYIKDNGKGIPEKDLKKVFNPFYTAHKNLQKKYGGSGLGLSICKKIMEKQNGNIEIENSSGTIVTLTFNTKEYTKKI